MQDGGDTRARPFMQHLLPWILASLSIALLAIAGLLSLTRRRKPVARPLPTAWALTARPVFSSDERRIYRQLREALPHHTVLAKLPLVRMCQPTDPQEVRFWYALLGNSHITFAVCSANGRVLAAIDIDNERSGSRRTVQIKQSVLAACRVRYMRCPPDHLPSIPELQLLVPQHGGAARGPQPAPTTASPWHESEPNAPATMGSGSGAARRRGRATLWRDSGFMQDSFFGADGRGDSLGGFGSLRSGMSVHELPHPPDDIGGVVVDTPAAPAPVRH